MSIKSKVTNMFLMLESNIGLAGRLFLGNSLSVSWKSLISIGATLKTDSHGRIIIGSMTAIRKNTELSATAGTIEIGDRCFINKNCMIVSHKSISIGNGTTIGPNVCIYDHDHDGNGGYYCSEICIGDNVWIGAGTIILKGVSIGNNAVIGAGSIVCANVPNNSILYQKRESTYKHK